MRRKVSVKIQMRLSAISDNLQDADLLDDDLEFSPIGDELFDEHVKPTLALAGRKIDEKLRFCRLYVANVYLAYLNGKAIHASRNTSSVTKNARVRLDAADALVAAGWVEMRKGFYNRRLRYGFQTRYVPHRNLVKAFEQRDDLFVYRPKQKLIFKNAAKEVIPIPNELGVKTWQMLGDREGWISQINVVNGRHVFRYRIWDTDNKRLSKQIGQTFPAVTATYNNSSSTDGGRIYGKYQNLRKVERQTLTIDGTPTVELDYTCLHPRMLYNMEDMELVGDAYDVYPGKGKIVRRAGKIAFNALLNARNEDSALKACNLELSDRDKHGRMKPWVEVEKARDLKKELGRFNIKFKEVLRKVRERHAAIDNYFGSGFGVKLQNIDVELVYAVCLHFCRKKVPILPVHDSCIIPVKHRDELHAVMCNAYFRKFGFQPLVE